MRDALNAFYLIVLGVCGWRVTRRAAPYTRGKCASDDVFLWLSAAVFVLIPVVADVSTAVGWGDPATRYPTILSVGGISGLLTWEVRAVWSRAHRRAVSKGG